MHLIYSSTLLIKAIFCTNAQLYSKKLLITIIQTLSEKKLLRSLNYMTLVYQKAMIYIHNRQKDEEMIAF